MGLNAAQMAAYHQAAAAQLAALGMGAPGHAVDPAMMSMAMGMGMGMGGMGLGMGLPGFGMGLMGMGLGAMPPFGLGASLGALNQLALQSHRAQPTGVVGRRTRAKAASSQPLPSLTAEDLANPQALLEAADQRNEPRCRALIAHAGFKHINQKSADGRTAPHVAMLRKLPEDVCLAILKHPDFDAVNAVDTFGYTLLILAASKGMSEVCTAVLECDRFTGINAQDKWGGTALHWAADQDLGDVCEKILSHPEFVEGNRRAWSFAFEDKTALDVAEHRNCRAAAEVIRRYLKPSS